MVLPLALAVPLKPPLNRSVSILPGSRPLIVTFRPATVRETPARKAVRPARAPEERSSPTIGMYTESEVTLTIRPKPRSAIPSTVACISSSGVTMFCVTPASIASRSSSRKSRRGGPPLLLIRISGSGQASSRARCPSGVETSAATACTVAPHSARIASAVASNVVASRPLTTTSHPSRARCIAQPRPKPRDDAQTIALRPSSPKSMRILRRSSVP